MEHKTVAIAIPYYKNNLTPTERISLNQCLKILGSYDTYFVSPESLDVNPNVSTPIKIQKFDDEYFKGIRGYNKLMLSEEFYQRFAAYDYVLIYQLDAFVFRDELQSWADKGYDYIGAPWIRSLYSTSKFGPFVLFLKKIVNTILGRKKKIYKYTMYNNVGNGGLSIRYVKKMTQITHKYKDKIENQLEYHIDKAFYPEDLWLACELKNHDSLKKPSFKEALSFAFDIHPQLAFQLNNHQLPFGCHGFSKPKEGRFWSAIITDSVNLSNHSLFTSI